MARSGLVIKSGWPNRPRWPRRPASPDEVDEHPAFGVQSTDAPKMTQAADKANVEKYKGGESNARRGFKRYPRYPRGQGVTLNQYFEAAKNTHAQENMGKIAEQQAAIREPSTQGGIPKKYPWTDRPMSVNDARQALKNAAYLSDEDRDDLLRTVQRLQPQILLSRRRF